MVCWFICSATGNDPIAVSFWDPVNGKIPIEPPHQKQQLPTNSNEFGDPKWESGQVIKLANNMGDGAGGWSGTIKSDSKIIFPLINETRDQGVTPTSN